MSARFKSNLPGAINPHAVVIGLDCITGLQTARLLSARGVPVIGIASDLRHPCSRTRICRRVICSDIHSEQLIDTLNTLASSLHGPAVLFPCTDAAVLTVSRHRERLLPQFVLPLSPHPVVELLLDKSRFYSFAQSRGLPIPRTYFLRSRSDAEFAAGQLSFPCILKPSVRTPEWEGSAPKKVLIARSRAHLLSLYGQFSGCCDTLIAQRWIAGPEDQLYTCNMYFNAAGSPLVTFTSRKLRQWPPEAGCGCLAQESRDDAVRDAASHLFQSVGFHGLAYLEIKKEARTGRHFIVEPNVGRPTGRSAMAEAAGVELLMTAYCDALHGPVPAQREQQNRHAKWIYLRRDALAALHYVLHGELSIRQWLHSLHGVGMEALFSLRDPAPFFLDLSRAFFKWARRKFASRAPDFQTLRVGDPQPAPVRVATPHSRALFEKNQRGTP